MKVTLIVLFLLAMLISTTQTFRHVYVKWIEPHGSVLDKFVSETETEVARAATLDELVILYQAAQDIIDNYESNPNNPVIALRDRSSHEMYMNLNTIGSEVRIREYDENQLFKLLFYWTTGMFSMIIGLFSFRNINKWLGLSGIIVGVIEMLTWTSPLFHNFTRSQQFTLLLNYKLSLSLVTWLVIISLWLLIEKRNVLGGKYDN